MSASSTTRHVAPAQRPEPEPPREEEDRTRWRTVYRGRGVRRQVGAVVEVELTPEQKTWLDSLAAERGLTLIEAVAAAIDLARSQVGT
jgi:hypothetical protein